MNKKNFTFDKAERLKKLPPYLFAELDKAKTKVREKGVDLIDLGVGDPDVPTPNPIINRLAKAAQNPENHRYPSYQGLLSFRKKISEWYQRRFGVFLDPQQEIVTLIGSKEGIAHISLGLLNPGDMALVPEPAYPVYQAGAIFAGAEPHYISLKEEEGFLPRLDEIDSQIASKAKLLWVNYPNNPTGACAELDFFQNLVEFAHEFDVILCHDLAYSELSYDGYQPPSLLEIEGAREVTVEFHSLSKSFSMTGWRIGFAVGNRKLLDTLREVKTNIDSGVFQAVQEAGIEALDNHKKLIPKVRKVYKERRDFFVKGLKKLGWDVCLPRATFYLWIKISERYSSFDFAKILLDQCGIVVTPGIGFGPSGEGYVRAALTVDKERLEEALSRLKKYQLR